MKQVLLFYIGNGILKCALSRLEEGEAPRIIFIETLIMEHHGDLDRVALNETIGRNLDQLSALAKKTLLKSEIHHKRIDKIICVVASPWYISETKIIKSQKEKPTLIREETIATFLNEAEENMKSNHSEKLAPIERKIIQLSLNGYLTSNPIGKVAKTLKASIVDSFIDQDFASQAKETILRHFHAKDVNFHSLSFSSFIALRDLLPEEKDFLIIDVTSLITEVSLIKGGVLHETVSLPIGFNKLIELLMKELSATLSVAVSILRNYQDGNVERGTTTKASLAFDQFRQKWTGYINEAFSHLSAGISLPSTCYIICQLPFEALIGEQIKGEDYGRFSFNHGDFHTMSISGNSFSHLIEWGGNTPDTSVSIAAILADRSFLWVNDKKKRNSFARDYPLG